MILKLASSVFDFCLPSILITLLFTYVCLNFEGGFDVAKNAVSQSVGSAVFKYIVEIFFFFFSAY